MLVDNNFNLSAFSFFISEAVNFVVFILKVFGIYPKNLFVNKIVLTFANIIIIFVTDNKRLQSNNEKLLTQWQYR